MKHFTDLLLTFGQEPPSFVQRFQSQEKKTLFEKENNFLFSLSGSNSNLLHHGKGQVWEIWYLGEILSHDQGAMVQALENNQFKPETLNGHFLIVAYHSKAQEWHVWTDRFGTLHAYWAHAGGRSVVGTFFPSVASLGSSKTLDWKALSGFFRFGFFPKDRTYYEDVQILKPASHYCFNRKGDLNKSERYWQWSYEPNHQRSYQATLDLFGDTLRQILQDQTREGSVAIPISGGLDSRSTVAALGEKAKDSRLWFYSYGYSSNSRESAIAQQIASRRGLDFQCFQIQPYLFDSIENVLASTEGFQDITQVRQAAVSQELSKRADYVIAAHWGDVWLDDLGFDETGSMLDFMLHKIEKPGFLWLETHVSKPHLTAHDSQTFLREMIQRELEEYQNLGDSNFRMKAFKTDQWSFRWTISSLRMFQVSVFPRLPFYDIRMTDLISTIPNEWMRGRKLQIDYLKKVAPDLAKINWDYYDANLYQYPYFNSLLLPKRAFKKAWRLLTQQKAIQRNWEVQFLSAQGCAGLKHWLQRSELKLHEFVAPEKINQLLKELHDSPNRENGYAVSMLLTFSAWLERYGQ